MARVTELKKDSRDFRSKHPTEVECSYLLGIQDGEKYLQLNSYGSDDREMPGKVSQTVQLNETAAKQLLTIPQREF